MIVCCRKNLKICPTLVPVTVETTLTEAVIRSQRVEVKKEM